MPCHRSPPQLMLILLLFLGSVAAIDSIISCYYRFNSPPPSLVPGHICTHIILIGDTVLDHLGHFQAPPENIASQFVGIKQKFPNVKLLLCQTGSNPDFSTLVENDETMMRYANESSTYLRKMGLDGLDLDWEFPSWSWDAKKTDKFRFGELLKFIRQAFGKNLLLTAAVSGPPTITTVAYEISAFNSYLDLVHVMNYDFHVFSYENPVVGFNAPLRKIARGEVGPIGKMNSAASMNTYQTMGLWKNITLFGIPTYNRAYLLVNSYIHKPYAPAEMELDGYGKMSTICELLHHKGNYYYVWNNEAASPYIHGMDKVWISIEDKWSVSNKTSYAMSLGIPGIMVFDIGSDDVYGSCGDGEYPLLNAIKMEINKRTNKL